MTTTYKSCLVEPRSGSKKDTNKKNTHKKYDIQLQKQQVKIIKCTIDQPYAKTSSTTITFATTTNIVQCPFLHHRYRSSLSI